MSNPLDWTFTVGEMIQVFFWTSVLHLIYLWGRRDGRRQGKAEYQKALQATKMPSIIHLPHLDGLPVACVHGEHPDDCYICRH